MADIARPFPPGDYDVTVVGSGPGGLQTSYWLRRFGARRVVLSLGVHAPAIIDYAQAHPTTGIEIEPVIEPAPLGQAQCDQTLTEHVLHRLAEPEVDPERKRGDELREPNSPSPPTPLHAQRLANGTGIRCLERGLARELSRLLTLGS